MIRPGRFPAPVLLATACASLAVIAVIAGYGLGARGVTPAARLLLGVAVLFNVVTVMLAAGVLRHEALRRARHSARLATRDRRLERRVQRRTRELAALSGRLQQLSEREKAALARALHDELGGLLIAAKMDLAWLRKRSADDDPDVQARWTRVLKVLDEGVDFKRRMVENLRPTLLDNIGLYPALRWITHETCDRAGLRHSEAFPEHELPLTGDAAIMIFRLVQESLTNVVRHAQATEVHVEVSSPAGPAPREQLSVLVADDGNGITGDPVAAEGTLGLKIMRHRVQGFDGDLEIDSRPGAGTRILARLPLERVLVDVQPSARVPAAAATQ